MKSTHLTHAHWVRTSIFPVTIRFYQLLLSKAKAAAISAILVLIPLTFLQGNNYESVAELDPITPILECVEDLGNGRYMAVFGFDNPNGMQVTVPPGNSRVVWYGTDRQEKVYNQFEPGVHESVLEREFDISGIEDGLTWIIRIPKKASMEASADATSTLCEPDISSIENFKAVAVGTTQIDLSWDQPTANEDFTYTIQRANTVNGPWIDVVANLPQNVTTYSDQGLQELTTYHYRIFASNPDGASGFATAMTSTLSALSSATNLNGKNYDKIGPKLTSLFTGNAGENPSSLIYQFNDNGDVLIEIIAFLNPSNTIETVLDLLQTKYGRTTGDFLFDPEFYINNNRNLIDLYFEPARLAELNDEPSINFARAILKTIQHSGIGATGVLSQGDSSQTSVDVRASFKVSDSTGTKFVDGSGIDVLVLSNSFNTEPFSGTDSRYVTDQKNLDLPGPFNPNFPEPVEVLFESPTPDTDEGRAMLQLIHDVAPGAGLGFYSGTQSLNTFSQGIENASLAGYNLTVDDITFLVESFFREEGPVYEAINDHVGRAPGNMHFSSAGNFADKAIEGVLNFVPLPSTSNLYEPGTTAYIHDFGGGDISWDIFANPGQYILALQWDEAWSSLGDPSGASTDVDMYVVNDSLQLMAGNNRVNILGDATELLFLEASAPRSAKLVFTCECSTPPTNLRFRMVAFKTNGDDDGLVFIEPISGPTVTGHAAFDIPNIVTTGAAFYGFYADTTEIEPFSSQGEPGDVDITGPDGANTNVNTIGTDINFDSDVFNNFFGTSASAPHIAASYALMLEAAPKWYPSGIPSEKFVDPLFATSNPADQARGLFTQTAFSIGNSLKSGAGLMQAEEAFKVVATQTSVLSGFSYDSSKVISVDTVVVTLLGDYFTPGSQVLFNSDTVETVFISETEIQAVIPPFSGTAGIAIDSKSSTTPGGGDGGNSNPIDLLEGRRAITVVANDASRTFGQDHDNLTFSVVGLVGNETYDSLGLPEVTLTSTAAGLFPDIGNYIITPSFSSVLSEEQQNEFVIAFQPGVLSIAPIEMTIQPLDTAVFYGEEPPFVMNYLYDTTGISNNEAFEELLQTEHQSTYRQDSTDTGILNRYAAIVSRFAAIVSENPEIAAELIQLVSQSNWVATETTLNRFAAIVSGYNILEVDAEELLDYLVDPSVGNSGSVENRFAAIVSGEDLVNGNAQVYDPIENRFAAIVSRFAAIVNRFAAIVNVPLSDANDSTDLSQTLALVDAEDGNNSETDTVNIYSLNMITGLSVTNTLEDRHYMVSGAALAPVFTNCIVNYLPSRLTINPTPITVNLNDENEPIEISFGDSIPEFTSTISSLAYDDQITISYDFNPVPISVDPIDAGTWTVDQFAVITDSEGMDVTSNYEITFINGTLIVNPGTLTLETDDIVITEGEAIPVADISTSISGFAGGQTLPDVFPNGASFNYSSPLYEASGRTAGAYPLFTTVSPDPMNYTVVDRGAQLFVNLENGQKINVFLDCVDENKGNNPDYPFEAFFSYSNKNAVSVFVPTGPLNELTCTDCDESQLPFEWLPGDHQFSIPFDGLEMRLKLTTFDITNPSSVSVDGNDITGNKCKGKNVPNGRIAREYNLDQSTEPEMMDEQISFYPNPVTDKLVIQVNESFNHTRFNLYNSQGVEMQVPVRLESAQSIAEFDFSDFETGLYLLKLNLSDNTTTIRILKQ